MSRYMVATAAVGSALALAFAAIAADCDRTQPKYPAPRCPGVFTSCGDTQYAGCPYDIFASCTHNATGENPFPVPQECEEAPNSPGRRCESGTQTAPCAEKHACYWDSTEEKCKNFDFCSTSRTTVYKTLVDCAIVDVVDPEPLP